MTNFTVTVFHGTERVEFPNTWASTKFIAMSKTMKFYREFMRLDRDVAISATARIKR